MTMNKPIRTIAIFCLLLFVGLMVNATYLQYHAAGDLNDDQRNRRVIDAAYSRERGAVLVGRDSVAVSKPSEDRFEFQRTYPQPFKYAPLTGFFAYQYGASGIERSQNDVLSGEDSRLFVTKLVDLVSNDESEGGNVQLTIDPAAQDAAYAGLTALGQGTRGSVVALQPSSGKVLAMVSLPTYDPNKLSSHDFTGVRDTWERLSGDPGQPLLNRAIQTTLPPGSTFKVLTAAAAIEAGLYTADDQVPGGATYQLPLTSGETGLIDNEGRACGTDRIPFTLAMENSCNTTFAALAGEVGAEQMLETAEAFGFNSDYLQDLRPQARSVYPDELDAAQLGQTGIGQFEVRATPLQMAMVVAGLANGGVVMRPYVVDEVQSADYEVLDKTEPTELSQAVRPQTADEVTELMVSTVENGTASPAAIQGVEVAGKTGTAQSGDPDRPPYAWFVSFAPDEDVAVAVVIENAEISRSEIAGGTLGGPIAKAVMEAVIRQ
ncbi:peptidoglycan D,D-transpeptidase FtsI family protein [Nocardioides abyssi]|uniref:Penicillin-binding protein 2 n=1 Tax=Nocardioides abyssi TaxID=3058370 RepID=A0ABT8EST6_9ACTN|nr:penicillin-binding protein 2 [Nocardioides abyssi]MDN4161195.1 penicillin-binding protein 2 [Nocardioides abyssi]